MEPGLLFFFQQGSTTGWGPRSSDGVQLPKKSGCIQWFMIDITYNELVNGC
jgi:hypothetical protein